MEIKCVVPVNHTTQVKGVLLLIELTQWVQSSNLSAIQ